MISPEFEIIENLKINPTPEEIKIAICCLIDGCGVDGSHHKQWYLNEVLRILIGLENYDKFISEFEKLEDENCESLYGEWNLGIAP